MKVCDSVGVAVTTFFNLVHLINKSCKMRNLLHIFDLFVFTEMQFQAELFSQEFYLDPKL